MTDKAAPPRLVEYKVSIFNRDSYPHAALPFAGIWKLWVDDQGRRCSTAVAEIEDPEAAMALASILGLRDDSEWTKYGQRIVDASASEPSK